MAFRKDTLLPCLIYNKPFLYHDKIAFYPVTMRHIISFQALSQSILVRKNSLFHEKNIIKMSYLDFLLHCLGDTKLEEQYGITGLSQYYMYAVQLLQLCCKDSEVNVSRKTGQIYIGQECVTPQAFDDFRRLIIIQNDIDFDIDEFLNHDTEQRLLKAQKSSRTDAEKADIEDYIDSLVIALSTTEEHIMHMTIRKFWRYIKRYQLHEGYTMAKTGEFSGMVKFKEPIRHWMTSLTEEDRYKNLKTDEMSLKGKISASNS